MIEFRHTVTREVRGEKEGQVVLLESYEEALEIDAPTAGEVLVIFQGVNREGPRAPLLEG